MGIFASIDTGSNAVRLLVARKGGNVPLERLRYERTVTRLAQGFFPGTGKGESKNLLPRNMELTLEALKRYSEIISSYSGLSGVRAVGTSALREAANGAEFIRLARQRTGIKIEAITHEEETRLSALGVTALLKPGGPDPAADKKTLILDIGGGSTEWMLTEGASIKNTGVSLKKSGSFPVGVVKLAGLEDKEGEAALERDISVLAGGLMTALFPLPSGTVFVVTGGTASTMASIDLGLAQYEHEKVHGHEIGLERLTGMCRDLSLLSLEQRRHSVAGLEPGRADLIIPGLRLTIKIMEKFGLKSVISSDTGLPEGIILDLGNNIYNGLHDPESQKKWI
ncbi:MAG: hypothetical protein M0Z75_13155 [Nitrospiraceae bacterium]|nr:hypothetical protein [Nitrospiraceae bacterium]MDA8090820.1 hypothetical protein [Nitrospiraceae bacterium]